MGSSRRQSKLTFDTLKREIVAQIETAISDTSAITTSSDTRIHRVRRRTKRIRAQLRMLALVAPRRSRKASKHARKASALLSPFRDTQIVPAALESVRVMLHDSLASDDAMVLQWLADSNCQQGAGEPALSDSLRQASDHFTRARKMISRLSVGKSKRISARHLAPAYERGRESVRRVLSGGDEDSFHELRKAVKCDLYQSRFMKPALSEALATRIELAKQLGDLLGEVQDIVVLQGRCRMAPATIDQREIEAFVKLCERAASDRRTHALAGACQLYFLTTAEFVSQLKSRW
jgi:CHAD domain-containing protein